MVTNTHHSHWIPLTWMTLGLDYVLWGMNPAGYHLSNVVLHAVAAAVFFLLARRLLALAMPDRDATALRLGAVAAALFFAVHPLRVESVAWVTERRDVLSGGLLLLAVLAYVEAATREGPARRRWLAVSLVCYALSLTAKAIGMTLAVVLLVLDVYPLRRLRGGWRGWTARAARPVWLEKLPYLALAAGVALITITAFFSQARVASSESYPPLARLIAACYSAAFYLWKTVLPWGLSPMYEVPQRIELLTATYLPGVIAVVALTVAFWRLRRRWPAGVAVWAVYLVTLSPVSGLVSRYHAGRHLAADRYSYVPTMAWAMLFGAAVVLALDRFVLAPRARRLAGAAAAVWLCGLAALASTQTLIWRDTETLWSHALDLDPECALCHAQLGSHYGNRALLVPALAHFEHGVRLWPEDPGLRANLGLALMRAGRPRDAAAQLRVAVEQRPDDPRIRSLLARAYLAAGDAAAAREQTEALRRLDPRRADEIQPAK